MDTQKQVLQLQQNVSGKTCTFTAQNDQQYLIGEINLSIASKNDGDEEENKIVYRLNKTEAKMLIDFLQIVLS